MVQLAAQTGAFVQVTDVTNETGVATFVSAAVDAHGPIDLLINNAAILGEKKPVAELDAATFRAVLDTNVIGTFLVSRAAIPHLVSGAVMLHLSSYVGRFGLPMYGAYGASKYAVEGLARVLAEELRDEGIISCAVDPGMVQTDMLRASLGTDDVSAHAEPATVARKILDFAERASPADTGTTFVCKDAP